MKVFGGEYATHGLKRRNNLEAALTEAVFMTVLEKNSDLVLMAAYAPFYNKKSSIDGPYYRAVFDNP